jgi:hypothetical protein
MPPHVPLIGALPAMTPTAIAVMMAAKAKKVTTKITSVTPCR